MQAAQRTGSDQRSEPSTSTRRGQPRVQRTSSRSRSTRAAPPQELSHAAMKAAQGDNSSDPSPSPKASERRVSASASRSQRRSAGGDDLFSAAKSQLRPSVELQAVYGRNETAASSAPSQPAVQRTTSRASRPPPKDKTEAAVRIQSVMRGSLARKKSKSDLLERRMSKSQR